MERSLSSRSHLERTLSSSSRSSQTRVSHFTEDSFEDDNAKYRVLKSVALFTCFLGMGLVTTSSTLGASLATMERLLNTDTKTISYAFTSSSIGFLTGAVLCAATFDRINRELLFSLFATIQVVAVALAPWTGQVYCFILVVFFIGLGLGFCESGGNTYGILLWKGHPVQNPFLQGLHFAWSVGSSAGPLIVRNFLRSTQYNGSQTLTNITEVVYETYRVDNDTSTPFNDDDDDDGDDEEDAVGVTYVRYAYAAVSVLGLLSVIFFLVLFRLGGCNFLLKAPRSYLSKSGEGTPDYNDEETKSFRLKFLALMCLFFFLYLGYEGTTAKYLSIFLVKYLNWNVRQAALAPSVFWGAVGLGRLLSVPVSAFLAPRTMLVINFTGVVTALVVMLFVKYHSVLVWISVLLAGFSMSSTFATGILWASHYIRITGVASAVFLIGSSLSSMVFPPFVGYMIQTLSPMWHVYTALSSALTHVLLFICMQLYATYTMRKNSKKDDCLDKQRLNNVKTSSGSSFHIRNLFKK